VSGRINNLTYHGGFYSGKGSIGTLTLVGFNSIEETGIDWGAVENIVIQ